MNVRLKVLTGSSAGKVIKVTVPEFLIGRDESCHLRPSSELISRQHCALLTGSAGVEVRDLKSRNGVFVNDEKIIGDRQLTTGDRLKIGKLEFEVIAEVSEAVKAQMKGAKVGEAGSTDSTSEEDISVWLDEGDATDRTRRIADPDTRQFKMDETDRVRLEEPSTEIDENKSEEKAEDSTPKKKKKPGKLPKKPPTSGVDSGEAATDTLKKFFNRR